MKRLTNIKPIVPVNLPIPPFDHKRPEEDDCGLPESPIFSNYSKYLWKGQSEIRIIRENAKLREESDERKHLE